MGTPRPAGKDAKDRPPRRAPAARPKANHNQPRGRRPRSGHAVEPSSAPDATAPGYEQLFRELIVRANQGERLAVERLRAFLDRNPRLWERAGDLTAVAERAWVELIAGADLFRFESVKRRLA